LFEAINDHRDGLRCRKHSPKYTGNGTLPLQIICKISSDIGTLESATIAELTSCLQVGQNKWSRHASLTVTIVFGNLGQVYFSIFYFFKIKVVMKKIIILSTLMLADCSQMPWVVGHLILHTFQLISKKSACLYSLTNSLNLKQELQRKCKYEKWERWHTPVCCSP